MWDFTFLVTTFPWLTVPLNGSVTAFCVGLLFNILLLLCLLLFFPWDKETNFTLWKLLDIVTFSNLIGLFILVLTLFTDNDFFVFELGFEFVLLFIDLRMFIFY